MKIEPTPIPGLLMIRLEPTADERGWFARTYCATEFAAAGAGFGAIRQTSLSATLASGTLRGLHWQAEPAPEGKLVRVVRGRVFDVVVDLRRNRESHGQWFAMELSDRDQSGLLIPPNCAHGFLTLENDTIVEYAMDAAFVPGLARGVRWDDPAFGVVWPFEPTLISDRDRAYPDYAP